MGLGFYRRRYERVPVDHPVTVTLVSNPQIRFEARLVNWSGKGACVEMESGLPAGSLVKIEVDDILLLGEVVHSQPVGGRFQIGVRLEHALYHTRELAELARRLLGEAAVEVQR